MNSNSLSSYIILFIAIFIIVGLWGRLDKLNPRLSMILNIALGILLIFSILNLFIRVI